MAGAGDGREAAGGRGREGDGGGEPALLDGARAAALLGVKRETLYAYASRGLVRSEAGPHGRARLYVRDDLERLRARRDARSGHGPVAAGALRWGEPVLETAVGTIDARGPIYRGVLAVDLARSKRSFEAVAELLWTGELPADDPRWGAPSLSRLEALAQRGAARPVDVLAAAVAVLALGDPDRFGAGDVAELARARRVVPAIAASVGLASGIARCRAAEKATSVAARFLVASGCAPTPRAATAVDAALVLLADHELNASSFAVRVAASTGADLYACLGAGLAAMSGPRHGGAVERVEAFVSEIGAPGRAAGVVAARARRGEAIPGFGHALYPAGDPRAQPLLAAAEAIDAAHEAVAIVRAVSAAVRRRGGAAPTVDVGLAALSMALGLPRGAGAALFALGRSAGWIAHALEQRATGVLLRPRARYTGREPRG